MTKKNISIIIPVYNGEKYIKHICKQIDNQTYKNFEVIFIDDCSTDNSYKLLQEIKKEYKFVSILKNKENSGAGVSRNKAIQIAKYDYIGFLDCDDEIPNNYFEELTKVLFKEDADVALCDVKVTYDEGFEDTPDFYNSTCHKLPVTKKDIIHNDVVAAAWNKIIKKELLLNNPFAEGIINEDIPAIIGCILDAKKIAYTNKTCYTYVQRKSSVQNGTKILKKFDVFTAVEELEKRKNDSKELKDNMDAIVYHQLILFLFFGIIGVKGISKKWKYLKMFEAKAKKYNFRLNRYYWEFINGQRKKIKYYYKIIIKLMSYGFYKLANAVIILGETYSGLRKRFNKKILKYNISMKDLIEAAKKNQKKNNEITISVVIPNYNYEKFLYQRIYSILYQDYKINELIILDDCSKDDSIKMIDDIKNNIGSIINIKTEYNKKNSGSPFKQWEKGFNMAKSDYVWIAEADDYSNEKFLKEVLEPIKKDKNIVLSYCDTSYIHTNGIVLTKTVTDLVDIMKTGHWDSSYVNDGINEIENYEFLNCTIANVSSVVFKKDNYEKELRKAGSFKQCGDWYFYYSVMKKGKVAYSKNAFNYCRLHGDNSTTNLKKKIHYNEIKDMQNEICNNYNVKKDYKKYIKDRLDFLKKVWELSDID